jgi:ParB family chromosome partitioning protein
MISDVDIEEEIEIRSIKPSSVSVRSVRFLLSDEHIRELASSIRQQGLIQPITVRPLGGYFEIVAGHRRFKACKLLRWRTIPAIVRPLTDKDAFEIQLAENIHRLTMDPVEEAEAFRKYIIEYGWGGVSELARIISKSEQFVSGRIQILRLPKEIIEKVSCNNIKPSHAIELVNLSEYDQKLITNTIINKNLSVRSVREIAKRSKRGEKTKELINNFMVENDYEINNSNYSNISIMGQLRLLKKTLLTLRSTLVKIDRFIEEAEKKLETNERIDTIQKLMQFRLRIHSIIDDTIKAIAVANKKI